MRYKQETNACNLKCEERLCTISMRFEIMDNLQRRPILQDVLDTNCIKKRSPCAQVKRTNLPQQFASYDNQTTTECLLAASDLSLVIS